jgi:hypothetical protein
MIRFGKIPNTSVYEFVIDGKLNQHILSEFYDLVKATAAEGKKIRLLGVIESWPGFTDLKAFTTTVKVKLGSLGHIEKYAVVSDKGWLESIMPVSDFLTPGMPVKHFRPSQREEAIEWLQTIEVDPVDPEDYFSKMKIERVDDSNIYCFEIDEEVDEAGISAFFQILKNHPKPEKIRVLGVVKGFPSFDRFRTFLDGIRLDFAMIGRLDRYAIVTDKTWAEHSAKFADFVTPGLEMKRFGLDEKEQALNWLKA